MTVVARQKWITLDSDSAFAQLFADAHIDEATTTAPDWGEYLDGDMFWYLSDGRVLAMKITVEATGYCDTCAGYDSQTTYYVLEDV